MVQKEDVVVSRRTLLATGALGALGLIAQATPAHAQSTEWKSYQSESGAAIRYPDSWTFQTVLVPHLVFPHQSFSVCSGPAIDQFDEELPDLSAMQPSAAVVWMLHYDTFVEGPPFPSEGAARARLMKVPQQFRGFSSFAAGYSGSDRSFILRVWVGQNIDSSQLDLLDRTLSSITVS